MTAQGLNSLSSGLRYRSKKSPCKKTPAKRTSSCSLVMHASITIEAAVAIPLFFMAVLSLFYMLEVMSIRTSVRCGMQSAAKQTAEEAYVLPTVSDQTLEREIIEAIGADRLNRSMIVGGASGISCEGSRLSPLTGILELKVQYHVRLPIPAFAVPPVKISDSMRMKGWTGYVRTGFSGSDDTVVYITEHGVVYHKSTQCAYLDLSIRTVSSQDVGNLRNQSEGKYHACEKCTHGASGGMVYITDYGDRYHQSLSCSGLKRTIYAVPISEAVGKGACSKCCR